MVAASLRHDPAAGGHVIEVASGPVIGGLDVVRQFYGLLDGHVALLQLEDSTGAAVANDYCWPNRIDASVFDAALQEAGPTLSNIELDSALIASWYLTRAAIVAAPP
jgi:hypothetical protein